MMEEDLDFYLPEDSFQNQSTLGLSETSYNSSDKFAVKILEAARVADRYYTPLLCLVGTLGNSLSLAVFCMDVKYRSQSSSFYLSALAISDTGFLISLFALWLGSVHHGGGIITSDLMCPLVMYLGQVTCFISVYLTVAFTIERYVAVHHPFSRPRICTRSKAKKVITALTVTALLLYSYAWVIAKVITHPSNSSSWPSPFNNSHTYNSEKSILSPAEKESAAWSEQSRSLSRQAVGASPSPFTLQPIFNFNNHVSDIIVQESNRSNLPKLNVYVDDKLALSHGRKERLGRPEEITRKNSTNASVGSTLKPQLDEDFTLKVEHESNDNDGTRLCTVPEEYYKFSEFANYIDSVVTLIIPFFLITYTNVRIAACVWKLKDQRQHIVATTTSTQTSKGEESDSSSPVQEGPSSSHYSERKASCYQTRARASQKLLRSRNEEYKFCKQQPSSASSDGENHDTNESDFEKLRNSSQGFNQGKRTVVRFFDDDACSRDREPATSFKWKPGTTNQTATPHQTVHSGRHVNPSVVMQCKLRRQRNPSCSSEVRVTKTLLLVSTVFLVLNLPAHAIRCAQFIQTLTGTMEGKQLLIAFQYWANILFNTNFAVNFLLYCLSGRNFRKSLESIFLRQCGRKRTAERVWRRGDNMTSTCTERLTSKQRHCGVVNSLNNQEDNIELTNMEGNIFGDYNAVSVNSRGDTDVDHIAAV